MTQQQFERWKDFALRMARTCFVRSRRPDAQWIENAVTDFFYELDEDVVACIVNWENSNNYPGGNRCHELVCDLVSEMLDGYLGCSERCKVCLWPHNYPEGDCRCEEKRQLYHEQWQDQWGEPVRCCLRAGLDCASEPSSGVIGFTAGDVRRMYPAGVPDWVFPPNERLHYYVSDEVNGTFAELPDSAGVVL